MLDAVISLQFNTVETIWRQFWRSANNDDQGFDWLALHRTVWQILFHGAHVSSVRLFARLWKLCSMPKESLRA
jgi:hypothetical protein